jgi:hypothetical protein
VITNKSQILVRKSVWAISDAEMKQPNVKSKLEKLDTSINNNNITEPALLNLVEENDILYPSGNLMSNQVTRKDRH